METVKKSGCLITAILCPGKWVGFVKCFCYWILSVVCIDVESCWWMRCVYHTVCEFFLVFSLKCGMQHNVKLLTLYLVLCVIIAVQRLVNKVFSVIDALWEWLVKHEQPWCFEFLHGLACILLNYNMLCFLSFNSNRFLQLKYFSFLQVSNKSAIKSETEQKWNLWSREKSKLVDWILFYIFKTRRDQGNSIIGIGNCELHSCAALD